MEATPNHPGARLFIPSSGTHHNTTQTLHFTDITAIPQTRQSSNFTAISQPHRPTKITVIPQARQSTDLTAIPETHDPTNTIAIPNPHDSTNTTAIPQPQNSPNTTAMVCITFTTGKNHYGYEEGVNATNLTSKDIKAANDRLAAMRNRRIQEGLLKATCDDPGYISPKPAATKGFCDYAKWTKAGMLKAMIARGLKRKSARLGDM